MECESPKLKINEEIWKGISSDNGLLELSQYSYCQSFCQGTVSVRVSFHPAVCSTFTCQRLNAKIECCYSNKPSPLKKPGTSFPPGWFCSVARLPL